jgi:hypothetical protein
MLVPSTENRGEARDKSSLHFLFLSGGISSFQISSADTLTKPYTGGSFGGEFSLVLRCP